MAKQYATSGDYGRVNGWLAGPARCMRMDRGERQAFNRLTYNTYDGNMKSYVNGSRKNVHFFKDGRIFEGYPVLDGSGDWQFEKCTS